MIKKEPKTYPLYLSGLAYHKEADSPVLLLREIHNGELIPLLLSHGEAQAIIRELQGMGDSSHLSQQFSQWISKDGYRVKEIRILPRALGGGCRIRLKKGFRSTTLDMTMGDGVLFSIHTGADLVLDAHWCHEEEHQRWLTGLSYFWSMNSQMNMMDNPQYLYSN